MLPIIVFAAAALGATPVADRVGPIPDENRLIKRVSYRDLNLARPEGVAAFQRRLRLAASQVCPDQPLLPVSFALEARRCQRAALASAQPQVLAAIAAAAQQKETRLAQADVAMPAAGSARP